VRRWLLYSLGPFEGVLVASACRSGIAGNLTELEALNQLAEATIVPPSIRRASREMGEQLIALASTWAWCAQYLEPLIAKPSPEAQSWHHAVAFGLIGSFSGAQPDQVLGAYLHQAALGMIGAGVRAIPVGHTHGQQVLAYLHDDISKLASDLVDHEPETAGAGSPFYEILCDEQTRLYARMFRS
jgi:urease accessory protein